MITLKQEPIFTLCLDGAEHPGFKVDGEWEGFKKLQHIATSQYVIVATHKARGTFAEAIDEMFAGFLKRAPEAEFYPIVATPGLTKLFARPEPSAAVRDVLTERQQMGTLNGCAPCVVEGSDGDAMARAAGCYVDNAINPHFDNEIRAAWPWAKEWWKASTPRNDLVKAGALILAEIERLDRAAAAAKGVQS